MHCSIYAYNIVIFQASQEKKCQKKGELGAIIEPGPILVLGEEQEHRIKRAEELLLRGRKRSIVNY